MLTWRADSDERAVRRVLEGDSEAFGVLVRRYLAPVQAVARAYTGSYTDAEDVAQEAFLKAYRRLDTLREPRRFGAWLTTIARHTAHSLTGKRRREAEAMAAAPPEPPAAQPDLEARELAERVHRQVMRLDDEAREILLLRYYSGSSVREIAALLGISPNAAKKRLARARARLESSIIGEVERVRAAEKPSEKQVLGILALVTAAPAPWAATAAAGGGFSLATPVLGALIVKKALVIAGIVALAAAGTVVYRQMDAPPAPRPAQAGSVGPAPAAATEPAPQDAQASVEEATVADTVAPTATAEPAQPQNAVPQAGSQPDTAADGGISGIVLYASGDPASGAGVRAFGNRMKSADEVSKAVCDAAGRFTLGGLAADTYSVRAVPPGVESYYGKGLEALKIEIGPGERVKDVRLILEKGWRVWGRTVDQDGAPVAAAKVGFSVVDEEAGEVVANGEARTADDGRYALTGLPQDERLRLTLFAEKEGYLARQDRVYNGKLVEMEWDLALDEAPIIAGRVLDADTRKPIPEFALATTRTAWDEPASDSALRNTLLMKGFKDKFSDPEGAFTLRPDYLGDVIVLAAASGYMPATRVVNGLRPGQEYRDIEILLDKGNSVRGIVVDEKGSPLEGAAVFLGYPPAIYSNAKQLVREAATKTDDDGSFELTGVPPGHHIASALLPDYAPGLAEFDTGSPTSGEPRIVLGQGATLQGRILVDGQPIPAKDCTFYVHFGEAIGYGDIHQEGETYTITQLGTGPAEIECLLDRGGPWRSGAHWINAFVEVDGNSPLTLDFEFAVGATAIEGIVRRNGEPMPRTPIRIEMALPNGGATGFRDHTDDNGYFRFESVPAGQWQGEVWWDSPDGQFARIPFTVNVTGTLVRQDVDIPSQP